ncbi:MULTISPECIES: flagellar assembly protein FliH [Marinimicrobium]|jgi:flagellar assembly protein FliH|uniref:Flagellar assembly protein FliH n=1 Tax=Marinimicrobium koreense TaxID=306545 RepID=A0A3N1NJE6_9GAMM|nr:MULTISPECIES: flagellar assembly protein FliH [Marinimicrobium]ROQ19944.1 flagellar assembly protein FliH [Marinimicrobium koreense]|tara:strand:- start:708 stop:1562 length:855 start_codon:yes stop_codon:yes gene_type:complete
MTTKKLANRIPAEELEHYQAWVLPPIHGEQDRVLPSAEREARQRAEDEERRKGEKIEDVDYEGGSSGLSAEEMQRLVDAAEQEGREQGYQAGFEQGRAEGYEAGQQKGWEEMRQKLAAEQQRFQHLVQAIREPLAEQEDALEQWLLDTVCALTRSLVERELLTDSSHIMEPVRAAVAALPAGAEHLHIYLNPDDLALVEAYAEEHRLDWTFHSDEALLPGGCRVETKESQVDFSIEHRLAQQLDAFVNRQLGSDSAMSDEDDMSDAVQPDGDEYDSRSSGDETP